MTRVVELAYAKINLTLDVLRLRSDGYHDLDMVMQSVSLHDTVTLTRTERPGILLDTDQDNLPRDRNNLAVDAAHRLLEHLGRPDTGLSIHIEKRIPLCAGTAGGSSDAAATLRGLNRLLGSPCTVQQLASIGESVGSDVPYCVLGGTARARKKGEVLQALPPLPHCHILLCKPNFAVSTPWLFGRIDEIPPAFHPDTQGMLCALTSKDLQAIAAKLHNVFEPALPKKQRLEISRIRTLLMEHGALGCAMSGTGPTVFGLFSDEDTAKKSQRILQAQYREVFLTTPI